MYIKVRFQGGIHCTDMFSCCKMELIRGHYQRGPSIRPDQAIKSCPCERGCLSELFDKASRYRRFIGDLLVKEHE